MVAQTKHSTRGFGSASMLYASDVSLPGCPCFWFWTWIWEPCFEKARYVLLCDGTEWDDRRADMPSFLYTGHNLILVPFGTGSVTILRSYYVDGAIIDNWQSTMARSKKLETMKLTWCPKSCLKYKESIILTTQEGGDCGNTSSNSHRLITIPAIHSTRKPFHVFVASSGAGAVCSRQVWGLLLSSDSYPRGRGNWQID